MSISLLVGFISVLLAGVYCKAAITPLISKLPNGPLKIVNGTEAKEGEFPYVVQIYGNNSYSCNGAIIAKEWILTAGHCTESILDTVIYGTNDLYSKVPTNNTVRVKKIYLHPKFFYNETDEGGLPLYDVALLKLRKSIRFNKKAQPLKVAENNDVPFHVPGVLAGWGLNDTDGYLANRLQKIELQLLDGLECARETAKFIGFDAFNSTHNLCSDDHSNGQCYGDSGTPFVIDGLIYGLASWSFKPCGSNPGTYSRLTSPEYRSFIRETAGV